MESQKTLIGRIDLEQMEFYAFHGCFEEEQRVGNKFLVDISFNSDCIIASQTDNISDAVNYVSIYDIAKEQMMIKSHLIENVASRIFHSIKTQFPQVDGLSVKLSKMNPPVGGKMRCVSVIYHH